MSKKKKNKKKNKNSKYDAWVNGGRRSSVYGAKSYDDDDDKFRGKGNLSRKTVKKNKRVISQQPVVPADFMESKFECNHTGQLIQVSDYLKMTSDPNIYSPMLSEMIATYGEDKIRICDSCFQAILTNDLLDSDEVKKSLVTVYAALTRATLQLGASRNKEDRESNDSLAKTLEGIAMNIAQNAPVIVSIINDITKIANTPAATSTTTNIPGLSAFASAYGGSGSTALPINLGGIGATTV